MTNIFWINIKRFDENISKAPRLEISKILTDYNFKVTLLAGYRNTRYFPESSNLRIIYFKAFQKLGLFKISLNISILFWLLRNLKCDDIVILSPGSLWIGFFLKRLKKCSLLLDFRTIPVEVNSIKQRLIYRFFWSWPLRLFIKLPDGYSFITELLKESVENEFKMTFNDYVIWHSGVNIEHFKETRIAPKIDDNPFIVTYVGVVTKNRGLDRVVQALSLVENDYKGKIYFQIIGNGPYLKDLANQASELGVSDRLMLKGYIPYELVPSHLRDTDVFICPLPDRHEWNVSSPIKVFEYLACLKPIILTPIVSHKNIINNSDFIVWSHGDSSEDLATAIEFAFVNRSDLQTNASKAIDLLIENYTWSAQAEKLSSYIKSKFTISHLKERIFVPR